MLPFGRVDVIEPNAGGSPGVVRVAGWALDDTGVASVRIYRNCRAGVDDPGICVTVLGQSVVFVGDAGVLPGKRPDVAAAFPEFPTAIGAGWSFQTTALPSGPSTVFAVATDLDGQVKLLGQGTV
jgi:hypothetical protein